MSNCEKCTKTQKKFRLLETDLSFQIKKLNEDMATLKVTLEIAHHKELKKHIDKNNQEKLLKEGEVKCWIEKCDKIVISYEQQLKKLREEHERNMLMVREQSLGTKIHEMRQKQNKILAQKETLKIKYEQQRKQLILEREQQNKIQQKKHEEQMDKIVSSQKQSAKLFQVEKTTLNQKIKQLEKESEKLNFNVYELSEQLKIVKGEFIKTQEEMNDKTILFKVKTQMKEKQLENLRKQTADKIVKIQKEFSKEKEGLTLQNKKKTKSMMEGWVKTAQKFEQRLEQMNRIRQEDLRAYNQNVDAIKRISEEGYIPKNKFNEEINNLNVKLINKEKDVQRAQHEIKQCKLEIVNKEDTYIKFFPGSNNYMMNTSTAPDIFIRSPNEKRKEYSIKKHHRASFNTAENSPLLRPRFNELSSKSNLHKSSQSKIKSYDCLQKLMQPLPQFESSFDMLF